MKITMDGSEAWSLPWHELQRKLALGAADSQPDRGAAARPAGAEATVSMVNSWLRRASHAPLRCTPGARD